MSCMKFFIPSIVEVGGGEGGDFVNDRNRLLF
jgi:hypothetical protein